MPRIPPQSVQTLCNLQGRREKKTRGVRDKRRKKIKNGIKVNLLYNVSWGVLGGTLRISDYQYIIYKI